MPVTVGPIEAIELRGAVVDLRTRALVAAVVPAPRFGREGEVAAGVQRAADGHADLADVSRALTASFGDLSSAAPADWRVIVIDDPQNRSNVAAGLK